MLPGKSIRSYWTQWREGQAGDRKTDGRPVAVHRGWQASGGERTRSLAYEGEAKLGRPATLLKGWMPDKWKTGWASNMVERLDTHWMTARKGYIELENLRKRKTLAAGRTLSPGYTLRGQLNAPRAP